MIVAVEKEKQFTRSFHSMIGFFFIGRKWSERQAAILNYEKIFFKFMFY